MQTQSIQTRPLGTSELTLTTVGLGAWAIGGPWKVGWGPQDDNESIAAIRRSLDLGCNWIDTAAIYGLGHSEAVVGRALVGMPRADVIIATKCGREADDEGTPHANLRPERIRAEFEASLTRLQTDYIDLYQIHWPDPDTGTPVEESWSVLAEFKAEGKVRCIGVSNFNVELLARCEPIAHVDSLQPPYSMLRREIEDAELAWCAEHGTGVIAYSPMASGLLTGSFHFEKLAPDDFRRRSPFFQEPRLSAYLELVENLRPIAAQCSLTVGQLAIAWTLRRPEVTAAIVGARNPAQVETNAAVMGVSLSPEMERRIEQLLAATNV